MIMRFLRCVARGSGAPWSKGAASAKQSGSKRAYRLTGQYPLQSFCSSRLLHKKAVSAAFFLISTRRPAPRAKRRENSSDRRRRRTIWRKIDDFERGGDGGKADFAVEARQQIVLRDGGVGLTELGYKGLRHGWSLRVDDGEC